LYAVRYALNGGTGIAAADSECTQADYSCSLNDPIHLSDAPTRDGYLFTGWKDQSNATHIAGASVTVTDTVYLFYAQWMAVDYTVSFDAAGGSSTTADATKHIGDTMTLPSAGTKIGYDFAGWAVGSQVLGAGATYIVGAGNAAFTAQWVAKTYAVSYNWNGGSGTPVADGAYVFGTSALSLPIGSTHSRDGYVFAGWSVTNGGAAIGSTIAPTQDTVLFARWADGAYVVTYNVHGGTGAAASASVARAASVVLPTPTRAGFTFDGWFEDSLTRVVAGNAGATYSPTASLTLHAKWVQNSLYGINPAHINTRSTTQVNGGEVVTVTHAATGTGATVTVPSGSLNNGTELKVSFIEDLTRPRTLIDNSFAYFTSVIVHWSEGVGDNAVVAPTAPNKPISLTLTNSAIKTGAKVFMILNGVATEAAEATQDGQVTILITQDPEFVLAATTPRQPASVSATTVASSVATVSWTAPTSTGGADITGYTATAMPGGATCTTTAALSCDITGLNDATTYTYSVVASNAIGGSGATAVAVTYTPPAPSSSPTSPTPSPASSPIAGDSAATTIAVSPTRSGSLTPSVAPNVTPTPTVIAPSSGAPAVDVAQGEASSQPVEFPVLLTFVMLFLLALVLAAVIFFLIRRRRS
jgi:uncharacterized repeat protein (TIGR02543 family)